MHPIMRNMRAGHEYADGEEMPAPSNCGIAVRSDEELQARKEQRADHAGASAGPKRPKDVFRDAEPRMAEERDLAYKAGKAVTVDMSKVLCPEDFSPDMPGSSPAERHIQAAELKRNATHTDNLEEWAHDTFMMTCRQLLRQHSTRLGVIYLSDFLHSYVDSPPKHELAVQMAAIQQHTQNAVLRRALQRAGEKNEKGESTQKWFLDLIRVIEMIVEEERHVGAQLAALNVTCNRLALHFAKKAAGGHYPSADKLAKTSIYFRRVICGVLALAQAIGCYERNTTPRLPLPKCKREVEDSDESYMFSLRTALEGPETEEESEPEDD
ncbi:52K protein [Psittacine adenovirus 3]|uniref:52K protein n=1 Tax=Psittacine adenovirus 3 TaxID=1580497 RepID=A0A5C0PW42_9ADEN|nr:52K protein [Psittacine adenovirus 3]